VRDLHGSTHASAHCPAAIHVNEYVFYSHSPHPRRLLFHEFMMGDGCASCVDGDQEFRSNPFPQFVATTASCLSPIRIKRHANVLAEPWQQSCPRETLVPPRCPDNAHRAVARAKRVQSLAGSPRQTTRYTTTQAVALALHSEPLARNQSPLLATLAPPNSIHAKQRFTSKARLSFNM
jgi:hypothetical protein